MPPFLNFEPCSRYLLSIRPSFSMLSILSPGRNDIELPLYSRCLIVKQGYWLRGTCASQWSRFRDPVPSRDQAQREQSEEEKQFLQPAKDSRGHCIAHHKAPAESLQ